MKFDIYPHQGHPTRAKELFEQAQSLGQTARTQSGDADSAAGTISR